ncbi:MAG: hypothetical protein RMK30_07255 [Anaerolineae bacterium]|nr:hypothetical protein [Anaerolineae bacterium]MDW8102656.1 hypothetical protein [Anaerolineae bacterium]
MELRDYLRVLRRRGWIILVLMFLTSLSAFLFSKWQIPEYKGYITIQFRAARADWGLANAAKTLLPSFRNFIANEKTAQRTIERLQLDLTPQQLLSKVATKADETDFTLRLEVRDYDGPLAQRIAQTMAEIFVEDQTEWNQRQDKQDRVEAFILNNARYTLYRPQTKMNVLAGAVFGALLGVIIIFFLEWLEADILWAGEDVERRLGLPVLGAIPTYSSETRLASPRIKLRR